MQKYSICICKDEIHFFQDPNTPSKPLAIRIKYLAEGEYIRPQANTNGVNATSNSRGKFQNTENDENVRNCLLMWLLKTCRSYYCI